MCLCEGKRIIQANEKGFATNIVREATHPWLSRPAPQAGSTLVPPFAFFSERKWWKMATPPPCRPAKRGLAASFAEDNTSPPHTG
jgi:hypothetical protein